MARPVQAALTSAVTFACGAAIPLLIAILSPLARTPWTVSAGSLVALAVLGAAGAQTGGAGILLDRRCELHFGEPLPWERQPPLAALSGMLFGAGGPLWVRNGKTHPEQMFSALQR